jgi:hypothetical protein
MEAHSAACAKIWPAIEIRPDLIEDAAPAFAGNGSAAAAGTLNPHILLFGQAAHPLKLCFVSPQV